ncbi:hypothetical protein [Nocardia crassostreae]|uniref:hypothetical protein n=1 Tax=Nocardia crassostreae TaxID=53428 RepID=UPI00082B8439|nr:hypothetical protein [Nocardia crassostreae]
MASYNQFYGSEIDLRPTPVERLLRYATARLSAWAGPKLRKAGRFLFAELVRGVVALAFLGFALAAAIYGIVYFLGSVTDLLGTWMPHWGALAIVSAALLIPAGIAEAIGLWQVSKMRLMRGAVRVSARGSNARGLGQRA